MIFWLLLSVLCFLIFRHFITSIQNKEHGTWVDCTLPLWAWLVAGIIALVPVLNFILLIAFELIIVSDIKEDHTGFKVKEGKKIYLIKIIDLLNKEY